MLVDPVNRQQVDNALLMLRRDSAQRGVGRLEQVPEFRHGRRAIAHGNRDLSFLLCCKLPGSSSLSAPSSRGDQPGPGPQADQGPLKLGQGAEDMED
jgi:hypothetical protein